MKKLNIDYKKLFNKIKQKELALAKKNDWWCRKCGGDMPWHDNTIKVNWKEEYFTYDMKVCVCKRK